jgi:hypothetical protein
MPSRPGVKSDISGLLLAERPLQGAPTKRGLAYDHAFACPHSCLPVSRSSSYVKISTHGGSQQRSGLAG